MYNTESVILMEKFILGSYDTFEEIPEGNLLVKENSNLRYVRIGRNTFIAREFIDSVIADNNNSTYILSYYNVKNNEKLLTLEIQKSIVDDKIIMTNKRADVNVIPLSEILNIKNSHVAILCLEDIDNLIGFKEQYIPEKKHSII